MEAGMANAAAGFLAIVGVLGLLGVLARDDRPTRPILDWWHVRLTLTPEG
jgi:hypothetical protein